MRLDFEIDGDNFDMAGEASGQVKSVLSQLGVAPPIIKKVAIAMYEAEINAFIHGGGGSAQVDIDSEEIHILIKDSGCGIEDLELAMQEGYSTASEEVRSLGFGAGMGLPNIKNHSDSLNIRTAKGQGTEVDIVIKVAAE